MNTRNFSSSSWSNNVKFQNLAQLTSSDKTMRLVWWICTIRGSNLSYHSIPDWHHLTDSPSKFPTCTWRWKQNQLPKLAVRTRRGNWKHLIPVLLYCDFGCKEFRFYLPHSAIFTGTCIEIRVAQILQKSRRHIKILRNKKFIGSKLHTENPQTLGSILQDVVWATWPLGFEHPWFR
jgi:hypothetical protein